MLCQSAEEEGRITGAGAGRAGWKTKLIFPLHKQSHPALQPIPDETLTPCSATAAQMQMGQDSLRISHHASDFCTSSIIQPWQLRRKLINQVCLEEKHKTKNRLTHSALQQGRRVTPFHSEMQKKHETVKESLCPYRRGTNTKVRQKL